MNGGADLYYNLANGGRTVQLWCGNGTSRHCTRPRRGLHALVLSMMLRAGSTFSVGLS